MFYLFHNKRRIFFSFIIITVVITTVFADISVPSNKNSSCEHSDESEFPTDLFTKNQRKYGAIILHIILFLYAFGAIAFVCEDYFLPTIKCICEDLKLSDDVAAATFMSIATSSPELFTNIIGTFITESDIGIGHVIGNGYYDMFFVAAIGGLAASKNIELEWWPLARDCSIYFIVALTLTGIVWDGVVKTHETIVLLILYVLYCFLMFNNSKVMDMISKKFKVNINAPQISEPIQHITFGSGNPVDEKGDIKESEPLDSERTYTLAPPPNESTLKVESKYWAVFKKLYSVPLRTVLEYTIPDVRKNHLRKYYPVTFMVCVIWIGVTTYLGTWIISIIGETIGVPDLIMGMVFMAAGGSVVEAYSVYYKAKRGECSIGLSNSMGCNNLDATLCLALPWFIKTLIPGQSSECKKTSDIVLQSPLIHVNCLLLVVSVIILFSIFYKEKFKLNRRLGLICTGVYIILLIIAINIESN